MSKNRKILLSIPTDAVGLLIGKEGKTFNEISVQSSAKLTLQLHHDISRGSRERYIAIEGEIDKIGKACRIIIEKLSSRNFAKGGEDQIELIKWVIAQSRCSMIIGRNGSGIKAINAASGSWVKIAHVEEACPGESQRLLYIRGTKAQNDIALAMVKQIAGGHPLEVPIDSPKAMLEPAAASNMTDFTIPGHIVREVLLAVDDSVDVQIDPDFDVYMGREVKVRIVGRKNANVLLVKQSLLAHAEAIKASASTHIDDGKILEEGFAREPFMSLKILINSDDKDLMSNIPDRDGVITKDILFRLYGVSLLQLPSTVRYSQSVDYRQIVVIAPQLTFMSKLDEILVYLTNDLEYTQPANISRRAPMNMNRPMSYNRHEPPMHGVPEGVRRGMEYEGQYGGYGYSAAVPLQALPNTGSATGMPQQIPNYSPYPSSPPTYPQEAYSPPTYVMNHYGMPPQAPLPSGQFMSYESTFGNNPTYLAVSPPSPPPPSQRYNSNSGFLNSVGMYEAHGSPIHGGKGSPLMNISYMTQSGLGIQTFGLDTAQVLPIITNSSYSFLPPPMPLSPQMNGSFFTGEYGIVYSPQSSPSRQNRKKNTGRGYRPDILRSRSSSADSMSSLDNFYQNLTSESSDQNDVLTSKSIIMDNPQVEPPSVLESESI